MNSKRGVLVASVLCAALMGAGCDRPNDTVASRSEPPATPAPAANSAANRAAIAIDDAALTAKVKAALIAEPGLKSMPIDVSRRTRS